MSEIIVKVAEGVLKGGAGTTSCGFQYNYFFSIPYAKPPIGELRFQDPQPPEKWDGIRDATVQRKCNPHVEVYEQIFKGDEDSLFVNVYTPISTKTKSKLPVLVVIHGGGFYVGSGDLSEYHPDQMITKGVVVVTMNYRLGPLGFMCLHTPEVPGNAGLKDQVFALRWVQNNIEAFGGDPQRVTIAGESAGAACIHYHMMSPMSRGLFSKTIMQSGTCISNWAIQPEPEKNAFELGEKLGLKTKDKKELLSFLRKAPVEKIIEATKILYVYTVDIVFCGVVEKSHPGVDSFVLKSTRETLNSGIYNNVPCIQGFNSYEGLFLMDADIINEGIKNNSYMSLDELKVLIKRHSDIEPTQEQAQKLYSFYFDEDIAMGFVNLVSDLFFVRDCVKSHEIMSRHNDSIYQYFFCYEGELNVWKPTAHNFEKGCCHDDENQFLYAGKDEEARASSRDLEMMKLMSTMWTNFVKFGNPTPETNDVIKVIWTPVNVNRSNNCLQVKNDTKMISLPFMDRMEFWKGLFGIF